MAADSDNATKIGVFVAILLVLTALINIRISAAIATAYLIGYGVNRLRKQRK